MTNTVKPLEAYQVYSAIKLHFESDGYDALKYNYKTNANQNSFLKRKDKYFFAKLAKKYPDRQTFVDFLVANFSNGEGKWAGDLIDRNAEENYEVWLRKRDSFSYFFSEQIEILATYCEAHQTQFDGLFRSKNHGDYPPIVTMYSQGDIALEILVVLDEILDFTKDLGITETLWWPDVQRKIHKYRPYLRLSVDVKKCRQIALSRFTDAG